MGISLVSSTMTPSANSISIYKAQSKDIELDITKPSQDIDGNPIDVPFDLTGCTLVFQVRAQPGDAKLLISKTSASSAQILFQTPYTIGKAYIYIDFTDTKFMEPGKYYFDVWVIRPNTKRYPVIENSEFIIKQPVSRID